MNKKTIVEISKQAGVSIATVSRVINANPAVSPATRAHVMRIMAKCGYWPNPFVRHRKKNKIKTIAVLTHSESDIQAHYYIEVLKGINSILSMSLCQVAVNPGQFDAEGLIALAPVLGEPYLGMAARLGIPIVVVGGASSEFSSVDLDNTAAAFEAVQHLIHLGHRRVAMITGPLNVSNSRDRLAGCQRALRAHDLPSDETLLVYGNFEESSGYSGMSELLRLKDPPTAVFAANDHMALGAVKAALDAGRKVPDDIAVVGFDDANFSAYVTPPLTTVRQPLFQIGQEAGRLMLEQLNSLMKPQSKRVLVEGHLVIRQSCGVYANRGGKGLKVHAQSDFKMGN